MDIRRPGTLVGWKFTLDGGGFWKFNQPMLHPSRQQQSDDITGVLLLKEPTKAFFKDDGEFGFVTTITIKEQNIKKELILWDRNVKDIQTCHIGDTIILKNVTKKWMNGKTEFHVTQDGSVKKRK